MTPENTGQVVFVLSAAAILYVYLGYPLIVFLKSRAAPRTVAKAAFEPTVSLIITAFNEERDIGRKLENTLALEYPRERLEIIVASDCSDDKTDKIVSGFSSQGVRLVRQMRRGGKTSAQNMAVEHASGGILVFSDATSVYQPDAVRKMIENFADPSVGCVAGKLIYEDPSKTSVGSGAKSYWGYETFLKESESLACSLIGVSGCIYAVRRSAYIPMYPEACSDFLIATLIYQQGLRTVYEPGAVCTEETNRQSGKEMKMRIRVISQTFTDLWRNRGMMNPFRSGFYGIQLLSHKLLRYSVPVFFLTAFVSSSLLAFQSTFFSLVLGAQLLLLISALGGWILERLGLKPGPLAIPLYFMLANAASVAGFLQFLRGERYASWEPIRDAG